jgi:hypothetical protein
MLSVLAITRWGPSGVPSKCDLHEDTLRFLLIARVKTHGFIAVESLAIHSRKVEPALIPYVTLLLITMTTSYNRRIFFFCVCEHVCTWIINTFDSASPYDDEHDACNVMTT